MDLPETQNSRDARIEALWKKLAEGKNEIDINGLQRGLNKIDHPLKNAKDMLEDVVKAIDRNNDRVIQYEEFHQFVENTERELLSLFHSIDRDRDGRLTKPEISAAFNRAGLSVPSSKLNQFFSEVDENHDGYISFEEWRNFLLFLPTNTQTPPLKAVLSYYSSTVSLNAEGDTSIREDTLEGLGRSPISLVNVLFGSIVNIAAPRDQTPMSESPPTPPEISPNLEKPNTMFEANQAHFIEGTSSWDPESAKYAYGPNEAPEAETFPEQVNRKKLMLIELLPDPGYFAAGALAGVISRTATAPLDRIKVFLIANVNGVKSEAITAAKAGNPVQAVRHAGGPLIAACRELWAAGGIRSLFAGNGLNVMKVMPESAIKFGSYEFAKKFLAQLEGHGDTQNINPYSKFIAGGIGGMVSQLVVYPIDTLKFRMQCETVSGGLRGRKLIAATWKDMIAKGGFRASYRGLTMGLMGMFPYAAIDLGTFEFLKKGVIRRNMRLMGPDATEADVQPGSLSTGMIGACSGTVGASIVYPVNVIRTRLQAQGTVLHPPTYDGITDVLQKTIKKEGIRGLFKGITPNLLKVVPAVSITYVVYENSKRAMHLR